MRLALFAVALGALLYVTALWRRIDRVHSLPITSELDEPW